MQVLRFSEHHMVTLKDWLVGHKMNVNLADELPEFGFIALHDNEYFAAGFIRRIEGSRSAFLENLIANPTKVGKARSLGIDCVVAAIISKCHELNIKQLLAYTIDRGTIRRSERFGFKKLPHAMLGLKLGE